MKFTELALVSVLSLATLSSCYTSNSSVSSTNKNKVLSTESINFNPSRSIDNLVHSISSDSFVSGNNVEEIPQFTYTSESVLSSPLPLFGYSGARIPATYKFTFNNGHSDLIIDSNTSSGRVVIVDDDSDGIIDFISIDGGESGAVTIDMSGDKFLYSGPISSDSHAMQLYVDVLTHYVNFLSDNDIERKIGQFYRNK